MRPDCTIGEAAKIAGVGVETVRFYERRKLLVRPAKPKSGARRYSQDAIARLQLIKRLQGSGFSLKEIGTVLALKDQGRAGCENLAPIIRTKIGALRDEISSLETMLASLENVMTTCRSNRPECPSLAAKTQLSAKGKSDGRSRMHARNGRAQPQGR